MVSTTRNGRPAEYPFRVLRAEDSDLSFFRYFPNLEAIELNQTRVSVIARTFD